MKRLLFLFVCLAVSLQASAQFSANIGCYESVLNSQCDGSGPWLDESCNVVIYWDYNDNGPDPSDEPSTTGNGFGQTNFNSFPVNGVDFLGFPGAFITETPFSCPTATLFPSRYFVRVNCQEVIWTSSVFSLPTGFSDIDISTGWTCVAFDDTCNQWYEIDFENMNIVGNNPRHRDIAVCVWLCAGRPQYLLGIDTPLAIQYAYAQLSNGCGSSTNCNNDNGAPMATPLWENGTNVISLYGTFNQWLAFSSPVEGWACLYIDIFLPVSQGNFEAVAGDGEVKLTWNTLAETSVERFDILRAGEGQESFEQIHGVQATNSATGSNYSFTDDNVVNGTSYQYKLATVNLDGSREDWGQIAYATPAIGEAVISSYALLQNYPNPFNPSTNFVFDVAAQNQVSLKVFNIQGELVAEPANGVFATGRHTVAYDASSLASGLYFYTVKIGNEFTATKKMLLVK